MFGSINRKSLSSYTCSILLPTELNSSSFIVQALYHILSTQNKWYNYNPLLSLTQANYSVITVRISYAHSLFLTVFLCRLLAKVVQAEQKTLTHKGWVRLRPRIRSVDVDRIYHGCQTQSEVQATLENSDSMSWTHLRVYASNLMGHFDICF